MGTTASRTERQRVESFIYKLGLSDSYIETYVEDALMLLIKGEVTDRDKPLGSVERHDREGQVTVEVKSVGVDEPLDVKVYAGWHDHSAPCFDHPKMRKDQGRSSLNDVSLSIVVKEHVADIFSGLYASCPEPSAHDIYVALGSRKSELTSALNRRQVLSILDKYAHEDNGAAAYVLIDKGLITPGRAAEDGTELARNAEDVREIIDQLQYVTIEAVCDVLYEKGLIVKDPVHGV